MAQLTDGRDVDAADWNGQDDRIANLEAQAINTGGTTRTASLDATAGWKEMSGTLSSTGSVTVAHNLGFVPRVWVQMRGNPSVSGPYMTYVSTVTSSSFIVFFGWRNSGATSWNPGSSGQSVTFDVLCLKGDTL